jgi:hypothetical protein
LDPGIGFANTSAAVLRSHCINRCAAAHAIRCPDANLQVMFLSFNQHSRKHDRAIAV